MNSGMDFTWMLIENSPLDGKDHQNIGFNPYIGFGFVGKSKMINKSLITNVYVGYLLIPNSNISGITYEELPHGININITFGIHKRHFSNSSVLMPE